MKARKLKKILNNTDYIINNQDDYIAIGSSLCHNLISVNKKTLKIRYALDTFNNGRNCLLAKDNLLFIWDKLQELIDNGDIHDIINGNDEIESPIPVYTIKNGELIKTWTDEYGWPNTTIDGYIMYNNTYFKDYIEAIKYGINEYSAKLDYRNEQLDLLKIEIKKVEENIVNYNNIIDNLKKQLNNEEY